MSVSWWTGRQITAGMKKLQQKENITHRVTGVGNGKQTSVIAVILDT
jgi:hypothetical protein